MGDGDTALFSPPGGVDVVIQIDFSTAVGLFAGTALLSIFLIWIVFERFYPFRTFSFTQRYFWRCAICMTPYVDSLSEDFSRCPHCHSLNQREEKS